MLKVWWQARDNPNKTKNVKAVDRYALDQSMQLLKKLVSNGWFVIIDNNLD